MRSSLNATVIIPFHRNLKQLAQSLPAARRSLPQAEILVVADGAIEDCEPLARESNARVIRINGPSGPAVARNRGAAQASGDVLVFVDTDVVAAPDSLSGLVGYLDAHPEFAAIFGAYDLEPAEPSFVSQYKNLSHACIHEMGNPEASTFWAGLGAMRAEAFRKVGGFDERFDRPAAEDIDLGYRVKIAGYRLRLDPRFRGKHLKRWTVWNSIVTDITARGIPWTQLLHRYGALTHDLNLRHEQRVSVVLAYLLAAALIAGIFKPVLLWIALAAVLLIVAINRPYYAWFVRKRGWWFAIRVVPMHVLYHLCNGVSFALGTLAYLGARIGIRLPGALPRTHWTGP